MTHLFHTNRQNCRKSQCGGVYFYAYGTAIWMRIRQKLTPPVLLFRPFVGFESTPFVYKQTLDIIQIEVGFLSKFAFKWLIFGVFFSALGKYPNRKNCRNSIVEECIFDYLALHVKCRFSKNSLLRLGLFNNCGRNYVLEICYF